MHIFNRQDSLVDGLRLCDMRKEGPIVDQSSGMEIKGRTMWQKVVQAPLRESRWSTDDKNS